jgi:hypothetical protein
MCGLLRPLGEHVFGNKGTSGKRCKTGYELSSCWATQARNAFNAESVANIEPVVHIH